jgi:hypothetical protein
MNNSELLPRQTLTTIVDNVTQARADIQQAFTLLQGAKERLTAVLGNGPHGYYGSLWTYQISDYHLDDTAKRVDAQCVRNAWKYVLEVIGLRSYMTEKRQKELHEQLEKDQFPTLTVENILSTLQGLTSQVGTLLQESAAEVFAWLRPQGDHGAGALKTNHHFRVGMKVIVEYAVETNWQHGYRLNSYRDANFRALGNVFSLLDGRGAEKYPNDLVTQLNEGLKQATAGASIATPYLTCKAYKNGRAHLGFTRQDLVDQLNQLGGDGTLPGQE